MYGMHCMSDYANVYQVLLFFLSSGGWEKQRHFHVFSYASCVDLTQLLSQPNAMTTITSHTCHAKKCNTE